MVKVKFESSDNLTALATQINKSLEDGFEMLHAPFVISNGRVAQMLVAEEKPKPEPAKKPSTRAKKETDSGPNAPAK